MKSSHLKRNQRAWTVYESFESEGQVGGREVFESEDAFVPRATGILDAKGRMIYREPPRIGFRVGRES